MKLLINSRRSTEKNEWAKESKHLKTFIKKRHSSSTNVKQQKSNIYAMTLEPYSRFQTRHRSVISNVGMLPQPNIIRELTGLTLQRPQWFGQKWHRRKIRSWNDRCQPMEVQFHLWRIGVFLVHWQERMDISV